MALIVHGGIGTGRNNIGVPVIERTVKMLAKKFDVTVFQLFNANESYTPDGFRLVSVVSSNIFSRTLKLIFTFWKYHLDDRFGIVHGFWALPSGFYAVILGKFFRLRSIVSILGGDAVSLPQINYGQLRNRIPRLLVFWTLRRADVVVSLTQYLVDNLSLLGFRKRHIEIIPWGIDTSAFTLCVKNFSIPIQFLHIGNLNAVKDQDTLLRAYRLICNKIPAHLTIIGEGILEKPIKDLAKELDLLDKITFVAPMAYNLLPAVYHKADILLHTSLSEGQCVVVTEAMSAGVLVCGTKVGIMYDLYPSCCVAVAVTDFTTLSHEVIELVSDQQRCNQLRLCAHKWADHHSMLWTVEQIAKLYNDKISAQ